MGRKKIQITKISDERTRQTTFSKRKVGLVKKAIELSVLCQCDVLLIGFGPQQIFTYSSADMDKLIEQYKAYDGVCEVFNNEDLDSLKPGKITTGCSVVQRKQGVSIPLTKKETPQSKPVSVHNTPMLPHPIASKPHPTYNEQSNMNGLPVFPPLNNGPMNSTSQVSSNQGVSSILTRKRKSIPGGWMSGIGLNDFPGLGFQNQPIAPLRTPPGPGPTPSFSLAPQESRIMKNPLTSPNPQQHGIPPPDVHSVHPDEMKEHVGVNEPDFHFAKKPKVRHHKAPDEDMSSQLAEDQSKLGFYSRNSNMNNFGAPPMSFLMGDPLTSNSPEMNLDSEMHDTAFYRFQDPLPQMSKPAHSTLGDGLNWMNSNSTQVSNGPSFTLASGNFAGQPQQHL